MSGRKNAAGGGRSAQTVYLIFQEDMTTMTRKQRSKAAAVLGQRGGLAWAKTRTPEELRVRAMKKVEARRAKARLSNTDLGAEQQRS
jgi:hypothetical protein